MNKTTISLLCLMMLSLTDPTYAAPILPNPTLTPGETRTTDANEACNAHTGSEEDSVRDVPAALKRSVYEIYGLTGNHTGFCNENEQGCEVDHLIPLKLGGANTIKNLWPESYAGLDGAFKKDNLEKRLIARVCRTSKKHPVKLPLEEAQKAIATDWEAAYERFVIRGE